MIGYLRPSLARTTALCLVSGAAVCALASPANVVAQDDATPGPITLPVTGMAVDPLGAGQLEQVETKDQPNYAQLPYYDPALGSFGSGFARPTPGSTTIRRVIIAAGGPEGSDGAAFLYVAAGGPNRVKIFDAISLAAIGSFGPSGTGGSPTETWQTLQSVAYARGEVFVLGKIDGVQQIRVYDQDGTRIPRPMAALPDVLGPFEGMDAAFGELWLTTSPPPDGNQDVTGQHVLILDALTGAVKGISRQPLGDKVTANSARSWWDISIAPEFSGAIVDRRLVKRGAFIPGLATSDSPLCTAATFYSCKSVNQRGTDAVPGMRWFLELPSSAEDGTHRPVMEFSIDKRSVVIENDLAEELLGEPLEIGYPGYYLTLRRSWITQQQNEGQTKTLSDILYNRRDVRIDWHGYLKGSDWLNRTKCLGYVVSEADIFVVGDRGERWFELADGFNDIKLLVDGVERDSDTGAAGQLCVDTTVLGNGSHSLILEATLDGDRTLRAENPELRIDNEAPSGTWEGLKQYSRATVQFTGTALDLHSGGREWAIEVLPSGADPQTGWRTACSDAEPDAELVYTCAWDTAAMAAGTRVFPDGAYDVRLAVRDKSSDADTLAPNQDLGDDGNLYRSPAQTTTVDNTPPDLTSPAPAIGSGYGALASGPTEVMFLHSDSLSGIAQTTLEYNNAADGSDTGTWVPAKAAAAGPSDDGTGEAYTDWDASDLSPGIHRVRATTTDRAGNSRQTQWQVATGSAVPTSCPFNHTVQRCYAGINAGESRRPGRPGLAGYGVRSYVTPPPAASTQNGFSYLGMAMYSPDRRRILEGGPIDDCMPGKRRDGVPPGPGDDGGWTASATYWPGDGSYWGQCFESVGNPNSNPPRAPETHLYTEFVKRKNPNRRHSYFLIDNRVRAILTSSDHYFFGKHGADLKFFGESDTFGRYFAGSYAAAKFLTFTTRKWKRPLDLSRIEVPEGAGYHTEVYGASGSGHGYGGNFNTGHFCVHSPAANCDPPTP